MYMVDEYNENKKNCSHLTSSIVGKRIGLRSAKSRSQTVQVTTENEDHNKFVGLPKQFMWLIKIRTWIWLDLDLFCPVPIHPSA